MEFRTIRHFGIFFKKPKSNAVMQIHCITYLTFSQIFTKKPSLPSQEHPIAKFGPKFHPEQILSVTKIEFLQ